MDVAQQLTERVRALGWPDDAGLRFAAAARGHNVVAELAPSPAWCSPLLAAVLQHATSTGMRTVVLVAPAMLGELLATLGALVDGTSISVSTATDTGAQVLVATPAAALALHQRSQFRPDDIGAVVFAWPETWDDDDAVAAIIQDIPRDAQRVVITTRVDHPVTQGVVERYARKASSVAMPPGESGIAARPAAVTVVPSPWHARAQRAAAFARHAPQRPMVVWTADARDHAVIRHAFGSLPAGVTIITTATSDTDAASVLCYDLPTPAVLRNFGSAAMALLVPPGTESYVARIAPRRTPLDLSGFAEQLRERDRARCGEIAAALEQQDLAGPLYALAPLFEEHDPQQVAAALYQLWTRSTIPAAAPAAPSVPARHSAPSVLAKLWVGAGKKDDATVADLVAILVREVGMDRAEIGRIELRDTFALVEVPADDAEAIATRLTGLTLRRRKLLARVDSRRAAQRGGP
jgi:ATP-dependent RNA helicase DeaD